MGFVSVVAYEGGTKEWKQKKFPITGECTLAYLKEGAGIVKQKKLCW